MRMTRSFAKHSAILRLWSRLDCEVTNKSPATVRRPARIIKSRSRIGPGRLGLAAGFHRNKTFELTLLTFCPPGPPDLAKSRRNSERGMARWSLIRSMAEPLISLVGSADASSSAKGLPEEVASLSFVNESFTSKSGNEPRFQTVLEGWCTAHQEASSLELPGEFRSRAFRTDKIELNCDFIKETPRSLPGFVPGESVG